METWLIKAGLPCVNAEENGNSFQYSCLENPMDRGGWQATVHGVARVGHDLATKPPPPPYMKEAETVIQERWHVTLP